ncbi:MAG: hypothetical protein V5A23_01120 [Halobacteriales archaeon]
MATRDVPFETESLTGLHWGAAVLALVSGVIHLFLGVSFVDSPMGWSFLFAGVVFVAAVVALLADYRRRLLYLLGIPFTGGQIVLWYAVNVPKFSTLGIVDKVAQVLLVVALVVLYRQET